MNDRIRAAFILAIASIIVAFIYVVGPKLLTIQATTTSSVSVGDSSSGSISSAKCSGYVKTGGGNTATYSITVNPDCDVIVQGFVGRNVGSYNWNNGAVAVLGSGSYTFTITDGSYQMANDANAHAAFCNAVNWIQTNGKALSETYPLSGWGNC